MVKCNIPLPPVKIQYKNFKFLITDQPTSLNMKNYVLELKKYNVLAVIRACEASYPARHLQSEGFDVYDLVYNDGSFPPTHVIERWFILLKEFSLRHPNAYIAIHCVSGLGRAPVLVAVALIELGLKYEEVVELIRKKKRGAINSTQLTYLEKYRPNCRLKLENSCASCCIS